MKDPILGFYDPLAAYYDLIFEDWEGSIERQASALDVLLESYIGHRPLRILDCACGIGTQALGLARRGHRVVGCDLSPQAIERATRETQARGLEIEFHVSDMTELHEVPCSEFDVVATLDNALPHLSTNQLEKAALTMRRKLKPEGFFLASIRDYDALIKDRPTIQGPAFYGDREHRRIVHQLWDWIESDRYEVHLYITLISGDQWESHHFISEYRCLLRAELTSVLASSGFERIQWLFPSETGFYQPIVIASFAG